MTGQEIEVLHTADVATAEPYRPQLMMTPADAKALADGLRENTRAILVDDVDFGVIPGTGSKPTLLKPGAEKLLQWFGLGHRMEQVELERDDKGAKFGVTYRCVVTKTMGVAEVVVATCDAYAGRDESKWKNAPWNTVIKMAEKRALVGAALQATGSSSLFTQDIEPVEIPEAPNPFVVAAIEYVRTQKPEVVALLKQWMAAEGVPSMPGEWTPEVVVRILVAVGTIHGATDPPGGEPGDAEGVERVPADPVPPSATSRRAPGEGEGVAPSSLSGAAPSPPSRSARTTALMAAATQRFHDRTERLQWAEGVLGRPVDTFGGLSVEDETTLLDRLNRAGARA